MNVDRGLHCENVVANFLIKKGWRKVVARYKTPFAEVDLIFFDRNYTYLIEVKSCRSLDWVNSRVSKKQMKRLINASEWLRLRCRRPVRMLLAFVDGNDDVDVFFPLE